MNAHAAPVGRWLALALTFVLGAAGTGTDAEEPGRTRLGRPDPWAHLAREEAWLDADVRGGTEVEGTWTRFRMPGSPDGVRAFASFNGVLLIATNGSVRSWNPDLGWQVELNFFRAVAFLPMDDRLVIAGRNEPRNIGLWDGNELLPMGHGLIGTPGSDGTIVSTVILHEGSLHAGGSFWQSIPFITGPVARWDGVRWLPKSQGLQGSVRSLVSHEGELIAAGEFEIRDEMETPIGVGLARWEGTRWVPVGEGAAGSARALASLDGVLYAAGVFVSTAGQGSAAAIARLDGDTWVPIGETDQNVNALFPFAGELWAGGDFESVGAVPASNVAVWDGTMWRDPGGTEGDRRIWEFGIHEGELHMVGVFDWAGRTNAKNIVKRAGADWVSYGQGIESTVHGIRKLATGIHAIGEFQRAGGVPVAGIARWNGESWSAYGDGFDRRVHDVVIYRDELIATGRFTRSGSRSVHSIARWDGAEWQPLGEGLNDYGYALAVLDDVLYAGGAFTRAGDVDASALAAWDGQQWSSVAGGVSGGWPFGPSVFALQTMPFRLVVGGAFEKAGNVGASNVAFFQLGGWVVPGGGLDNWVMSFEMLNERVVAGGAPGKVKR